MTENKKIGIPLEHRKKLEKLESLKTELAKLISERDTLENTVKKNLEALYVTKIGKNEYTLFKNESEVARLKRKIELFQSKLNHGKKFDIIKIEKKLDDEYKKWEKQMSEMLENIEKSKKRLKSLMGKEDSIKLQKTYRSLIKKLHPDVNNNQTDKTKMLWNRTIEAYAIGDLEELTAISLLVDDIDTETEDYSGPDIDERADKISKKVFTVLEYIKRIKSEFPFTIQDYIDDEEWVTNKNAEINKKIKILEEKKQELKNIIDQLILKNIEGPKSETIN